MLTFAPAMSGAPATPAGPSSGLTAAAPSGSQSCQRCHLLDVAFNHPTNVRPTMAVPAHLPLDQGRVTCTTCHTQTQHTGRGVGPMLRPMVAVESFCAQCHQSSAAGRSNVHASNTERAHLRPKSSDSTRSRAPARLDDESLSCMSCHDGATAVDVGSHSGMSGAPAIGPREHPIGVAYPTSAIGDGEHRLVAPQRLDERIRLFDQAIGCGSCHSIYSGQDNLLVMSNQRSRLCLSCHIE